MLPARPVMSICEGGKGNGVVHLHGQDLWVFAGILPHSDRTALGRM